jgi:hypothetical protein
MDWATSVFHDHAHLPAPGTAGLALCGANLGRFAVPVDRHSDHVRRCGKCSRVNAGGKPPATLNPPRGGCPMGKRGLNFAQPALAAHACPA